MPPADYIQQSLGGAFRLMMGKKDGIRHLDLSADGFWTSFFAIVVAFPAMTVGWVTLTHDLAYQGDGIDSRLSIVVRLATIDIVAWLAPFLVLAVLARPLGLANRFVHYVVAMNWANAIFAWLILPPALVRLFAPEAGDGVMAFSLGLFFLTMFLAWRVTNASLDKGPAIATGVFSGLFFVSLIVLFALQGALGIIQSP